MFSLSVKNRVSVQAIFKTKTGVLVNPAGDILIQNEDRLNMQRLPGLGESF
jgi:hypothetical protein